MSGHIYDEDFPKAIFMKVPRANIVIKFHCIEEANFGLVHDYSPTFNGSNDDMVDDEELFVNIITTFM